MKRQIKEPNLIFKKVDPKTILTNFWARRFIEECDNPELLYHIAKDPTNPLRKTPEELRDILREIENRVRIGEVSESILDKILNVVD